MRYQIICRWLDNYLWMIFMLLGILGFVTIICFMPLKQEIQSTWQFYLKLFVYFLIALSIGFFPNRSKLEYLLVFIAFLICLGLIIPRIAFLAVVLSPAQDQNVFEQYYTLLYFILYPFITLLAAFAFRVGGGNIGHTIKIALGGQIFLLSGYLDIMWLLINGAKIPEVLNHAYHIKIIIGHFPTFQETIFFALFHIPVFLGLLGLPLDRWIKTLLHYDDRWDLLSF